MIENYIHEIITYILSCFLPSVNKDLQIQKNIIMQIKKEEEENDIFYRQNKYYNDYVRS